MSYPLQHKDPIKDKINHQSYKYANIVVNLYNDSQKKVQFLLVVKIRLSTLLLNALFDAKKIGFGRTLSSIYDHKTPTTAN